MMSVVRWRSCCHRHGINVNRCHEASSWFPRFQGMWWITINTTLNVSLYYWGTAQSWWEGWWLYMKIYAWVMSVPFHKIGVFLRRTCARVRLLRISHVLDMYHVAGGDVICRVVPWQVPISGVCRWHVLLLCRHDVFRGGHFGPLQQDHDALLCAASRQLPVLLTTTTAPRSLPSTPHAEVGEPGFCWRCQTWLPSGAVRSPRPPPPLIVKVGYLSAAFHYNLVGPSMLMSPTLTTCVITTGDVRWDSVDRLPGRWDFSSEGAEMVFKVTVKAIRWRFSARRIGWLYGRESSQAVGCMEGILPSGWLYGGNPPKRLSINGGCYCPDVLWIWCWCPVCSLVVRRLLRSIPLFSGAVVEAWSVLSRQIVDDYWTLQSSPLLPTLRLPLQCFPLPLLVTLLLLFSYDRCLRMVSEELELCVVVVVVEQLHRRLTSVAMVV